MRSHRARALAVSAGAAIIIAAITASAFGHATRPPGRTRRSPAHPAVSPAPTSAAAATSAAASVASGSAAICVSASHPDLAAQLSAGITGAVADGSLISVAVTDTALGLTCQLHPDRSFHSASIVKVIILSALLRELQEEHATLTSEQETLATEMITESDNDAATALWNDVGTANLQQFLTLSGMTHTTLGQDGYWGLTDVNAHDETLLLQLLITDNTVLDQASRAYALSLMADVVPAQRWGVTAGLPDGVTAHLKNGWLPDPDLWVINSIGDVTSSSGDYSMVILSKDNATMAAGISAVQAVARVINQDLAQSRS